MLLGISPVRISLAGGGTDMPEYYEKHGGIVITSAINHFTYVIVNQRKDDKLQIFSPDFETHSIPQKISKLRPKKGTELPVSIIKFLNYKKGMNLILSSDVPPRSGLGSSSSLAVNLVNVISFLKGSKISKYEVADLSHHIARNILKWPLGKQDEYIASFGGFKKIEFKKDKIMISPILTSQKTMKQLEKNLLLFFVGSRTTSSILTSHINKIKKNDQKTMDSLCDVTDLAHDVFDSIKKSNLTGFGELLHKGWESKKKFSNNVSNPKIDKIYQNALNSGAIGGKLTGAGGGGHLLLYCEKSKQPKVIKKMESFKLKQVKFSFFNDGAKILNLYDYTGTK
ncbi:D-glycero-D-manno-heptose 7-phosphate kinase [Nitrosopumilus sp. b2]|uniref:GHMP family kinase ATP-binding protein n=1 Tax=Nitrosopumilus sp. b2 TaxID=2109908 RepID=UPI0015F4AA1B|nr:D-glycero-D-manno-heptose 7-phosphate kinase [Nitrosopumilus sp. b2]KAF6245792.1 D-glycero-D-manno-heptose 7-phosphate kinase [Nitrosopumilus sp. b2]